MKAFLCIVLLVLTANAAKVHKPGYVSTSHINELKKGNTWASLIMTLAEMHTLAQGPFDDLIAAIESVLVDLDHKTESAHTDFERRTQQHNSDVRRLNDLVNEATRNIADSQALISNVLIPQREQLTNQIADIERRIEETKVYITQQTEARQVAHADFLVRIEEHNSAISVLDEALKVLGQLEEGQVSLVQVKRAHKTMEKVSQVLQKHKYSVEATFIKSLISLSTNEFVNQDAVTKVKELMLKVQSNLYTSITTETDSETKAQSDFEADMQRSSDDIINMTAQLEETNKQLSTTEEQIVVTQQYIEEREADKAAYTVDLQEENTDYENATKVYEDLVATLERERSACQEAYDVVKSATVEDYIGGRMSQTSDKVIGTNHGSGVEVAGGRFQFD